MRISLQDAKDWLRIDSDDEDQLIQGLVVAAKNYIHSATGRKTFGEQEQLAKTCALYFVSHWYEERDFYNPSPQSVRKPVITMMMTQLQYGTGDCVEDGNC